MPGDGILNYSTSVFKYSNAEINDREGLRGIGI